MILHASAVKEKAASLGFIACGITDTSPALHGAELDEWLARGFGGTMRYLHRQAARRKEPARIVPEAKSVVVVLDNYFPVEERSETTPKIAKYARGRDYHLDLVERLDQLSLWLKENGAAFARVFADAGPVPERELAQRAGLGWIGKNTMLIRPGTGSFFFIGSVFTDLDLPLDAPFESDRCGSCTRCLDACPTSALVAPRVLDATRCISYLTIEYRGEFDQETQGKLEGWAFGCDVCNDVCPWNISFAEPTDNEAYQPREPIDTSNPDFYERMSEEEFVARFADTPLSRPGLTGMRRNWRAAFWPRSGGQE
jgi:epoxyqueuosine reductase